MIAVLNPSETLSPELNDLSDKYNLEVVIEPRDQYSAYFVLGDGVLGLQPSDLKQNFVSIDFCSGELLHMQKNSVGKKQLLAKAVGVSKGTESVWDLTSGLLKDSFFFSCLGLAVKSFERSPYVFELQKNALKRAKENCPTSPSLAIEIQNMTAQEALRLDADKPDVVYLDPMFPEKDKSALSKKGMQLFQSLLEANTEVEVSDLVRSSMKIAKKRVVLKRPLSAPPISEPSLSFEGKSIRYDVYLVNS